MSKYVVSFKEAVLACGTRMIDAADRPLLAVRNYTVDEVSRWVFNSEVGTDSFTNPGFQFHMRGSTLTTIEHVYADHVKAYAKALESLNGYRLSLERKMAAAVEKAGGGA